MMVRTVLFGLTLLGALGCGTSNTATEGIQPPASPPETQDMPSHADLTRMIGQVMPAFEFKTIDGQSINNQTFRGKAVLFDFWASWCTVCKEAEPQIHKLYTDFHAKGLEVYSVNALEGNPDKDSVAKQIGKSIEASKKERFAAKQPYPSAVYGDPFLEHWGFPGVPVFVLIDKAGKVAYVSTQTDAKAMKALRDKVSASL